MDVRIRKLLSVSLRVLASLLVVLCIRSGLLLVGHMAQDHGPPSGGLPLLGTNRQFLGVAGRMAVLLFPGLHFRAGDCCRTELNSLLADRRSIVTPERFHFRHSLPLYARPRANG